MRCHLFSAGLLLAVMCSCKSPEPAEFSVPSEKSRRVLTTTERGGLKPGAPTPLRPPAAEPQFPQVAPISEKNGKVAAVRPELRFVVIDFYLNSLPPVGERLSVYRQGVKVGEVRISGPSRGNNIAADITAGEARTGDDVRPD